jgi:acetylornithine deacetylase/succinyl-diaminopimelate desuccinylase-like protein
MAKISMRLVANQRWEDIAQKFKEHVESLAPSGTTITVKPLHGGDPSQIDRDTPAMASAALAIERVFGTPPVYCREGGSIPVVGLIKEELDMPTVMVGFGLPDDRLHSPNEQFTLDQFRRGIETIIELYCEI